MKKSKPEKRKVYFIDKWFECPHCGLSQPRDVPGIKTLCYQCGREV